MSHEIALIVLSLAIPLIAWLFQPGLVMELIKDLRVLRILHYVSLIFLGVSLYAKNDKNWAVLFSEIFLLKLIILIIAITYAAVFAIVSNNFEDLETDKISNKNRPLVTGSVEEKTYWNAGFFCLVFALSLAGFTQIELFYGVGAISLGYYLYSCKPFRLKKIPILSKMMIGLNSLVMALTGFTILGGQVSEFPGSWIFFIFVPLSLSANFVDLKDTEGDRQMGVKTLPVLLGENKARFIISIATAFTYLMAGFLLKLVWLFPLIIFAAALHIWLLYRNPYREQNIFLLYVFSLFALSCFLLFL